MNTQQQGGGIVQGDCEIGTMSITHLLLCIFSQNAQTRSGEIVTVGQAGIERGLSGLSRSWRISSEKSA